MLKTSLVKNSNTDQLNMQENKSDFNKINRDLCPSGKRHQIKTYTNLKMNLHQYFRIERFLIIVIDLEASQSLKSLDIYRCSLYVFT
jgi:hypothetical protein